MHSAVLFILLSPFVIPKCLAGKKPFTIVLPVSIPMTGDGERKGEACVAAARVAVDMFNTNQVYLERYNIDPLFIDEGKLSNVALARLIQYKRRKFDKTHFVFPSPLIVGGYYTPGCKALAKTVHHLDMVHVAFSCGSPAMTEKRKVLPNFYRTRGAGNVALTYGTLSYIMRIGKWRRIAILTEVSNSYSYKNAISIQREARKNGVEVEYFDFASRVDETSVQRLKDSQWRIVVFSVAQSKIILQFLCLAYKVGMVGSRYIFIISYTGAINPTTLPANITSVPGCTLDMVTKMLKSVKWSGSQQYPLQKDQRTTLGYDYSEFLQRYNRKLGNIKQRPADDVKKALCHDAITNGLLALDSTEKSLGLQNMSLGDYSKHSNFVMHVLNKSMGQVEYEGLRAGNMKYSKRLEVDDDPQVIVSWNHDLLEFQVECRIRLRPNGNPKSISDYNLTVAMDKIDWFTEDGKPPNESFTKVITVLGIPNAVVFSILVLSAISVITDGLVMFFKRKALTVETATMLVGCVSLNLSAIFCAIQSHSPCMVRIIFIVFSSLSFTSTSWNIASRLLESIELAKSDIKVSGLRTSRTIKFPRRTRVSRNSCSNVNEANFSLLKVIPIMHSKYTILYSVAVVGVLIAWLTSDPVKHCIDVIGQPIYDEGEDLLETRIMFRCCSNWFAIWSASLLVLVLIAIMYAALKAYKVSRFRPAKSKHEFKVMTFVLSNTALLITTSSLVMVAVQSAILQDMVLGIFTLLFSLLTAIFLAIVIPKQW